MIVLFLDIDGVINSVQSCVMYNRHNKGTVKQEWNPYEEFCPLAVNNLVEILESIPDLMIVVSSTWRKAHNTTEGLKSIFDCIPENHGRKIIQDRIIDRTPIFHRGPRGDEIQDWLEKHPEVSDFAILDDDSDMLESQKSSFFQTDGYVGLTWRDCDKVISHFGGKRT